MRFDFGVVSRMQDRFDTFSTVQSDVLLLTCSKSPSYLQRSAIALEQVLPRARRFELEGLDHSSAWNADRGGKPLVVASAIRDFMA